MNQAAISEITAVAAQLDTYIATSNSSVKTLNKLQNVIKASALSAVLPMSDDVEPPLQPISVEMVEWTLPSAP